MSTTPPRRASSMTLQATHLYIPDEKEVWVDCILQGQIDENTIRVCDANGNMHSVNVSSCLSGITYPEDGFHDMTTMSSLHEASVLQNLRIRFQRRLIYTKIGDILVSVNPFTTISSYDDEIDQIRHSSILSYPDESKQLLPHVYVFADELYRQIRTSKLNQAVIISGESGAGKTEANKFIVHHLSKQSSKCSAESSGIDKRVTSTSCVLEAFGNAKTIRNNNSSRFGKLFECQFNETGALIGAKFEYYLLEKSRVSVQNANERNFHIFYYLLAGAPKELQTKCTLPDRNALSYLNGTGCYDISGEDPASEFQSLMRAMFLSGFTKEEFQDLMAIMCAILHLGNVKFIGSGSDAVSIDNSISASSLTTVGEILGCPPDELSFALTKRVAYVREEMVSMQNDLEQASSTRDTLAQQLYERCFQFIMRRLNQEFESDKAQVRASILLLDIFGFESFKTNSFEQLCINYANEKLQLLFNEYLFKFELEEYSAEGIDIGNIVYYNNQPCIDLFEKIPLGFIRILDEESKFPKATDATLLAKLEQNFSNSNPKNADFIRQRFGGFTFSIKHYCGTVSYTVTGFLVKNRQQFSTSLATLIAKCQSVLIAHLFDDVVAITRQSPSNIQKDKRKSTNHAISKKTLIVQFHESLVDLQSRLSCCDPHFIRCIKSNSTNAPLTFDCKMVAGQIRDIGIVEAIRIRSEGYPQRHSFDSLFKRFGTLCPATRNRAIPQQEQLAFLFRFLGIEFPSSLVKIGKSKVFFKVNVYERLEALVGCVLAEMATRIQRNIRCMQHRLRYRQKRKGCRLIQYSIRNYIKVRWDFAIKIQSLWRGHLSRLANPKPARSIFGQVNDEPADTNGQLALTVADQHSNDQEMDTEQSSFVLPVANSNEENPLPELDELPLDARRLIKSAMHDDLEPSSDFLKLLNLVLDQATQDHAYMMSIARCRHLRHLVLILGSDIQSIRLLYLIATSSGHISRFINAGGMIKVKDTMFTSCSKPTVFDDGEAETALQILQHILSLPSGPEAIADDVEIVKGITICLYCRPNDVSLAKHCSSVLAELIWKHPLAAAVVIRLGGIEAVIQAWSFHGTNGSDPLLTSIYCDIIRLLTHPQIIGNSATLDIISELTKSPVELALHGLQHGIVPYAEYGAHLATALVKTYPALIQDILSDSLIRTVQNCLDELCPPSNVLSLLKLLLQFTALEHESLPISIDCNIVSGCLRKYNGLGGPICLSAVRILSRTTQTLPKNIAFALAECHQLNLYDLDLFRACHSMFSRYPLEDPIAVIFDVLRKRSSSLQDCLYALSTIASLCSVEGYIKQLVDMGAINVLIYTLQSNHQCQGNRQVMCPNSLTIQSLALLLQQSWPAQVQFRQCSGLRFVKGVKICCEKLVSANLDVTVAFFTSSGRKEDAIAQLNLCHSEMQTFLQISPTLCIKFLTTFPSPVLVQVSGTPATVLSILSYHSGIDEHVTNAVASILPSIFKGVQASYSRNVCEIVVANALLSDVMRDWRLLSAWLTIIGHCVSHIRQSGPANELLTPDMFALLLTVSEASNVLQSSLHAKVNHSIATQLLTEMIDTEVVAEVAITVLRRQSLEIGEHPSSPSSLSVLLPSGNCGAASVISFLAIDEHTSMQLYRLQVLSALDAALHAVINSPESPEREQCCDVVGLALQRLSRHVKIRSALHDSGILRTLDVMLVNVCPHYPNFVERATRCIKNVSSDSRASSPSRTKAGALSRTTADPNVGALNKFRNIFATVINIGGNEAKLP